jgi:hypothetical protein
MATELLTTMSLDKPLSLGRRLANWAAIAVIACSSLVMLTPGTDPTPPPSTAPSPFRGNAYVHWRDATHDWLIVVDRVADQLVVYDARDGRPLRHIGAGEGLTDIDALAQSGGRLLVKGDDTARVRVVNLPSLRLADAN